MDKNKRTDVRIKIAEAIEVVTLIAAPAFFCAAVLEMWPERCTDMIALLSYPDAIAACGIFFGIIWVLALAALILTGIIRRKQNAKGLFPRLDAFVRKHVLLTVVILTAIFIALQPLIIYLIQDPVTFYPSVDIYNEGEIIGREGFERVEIENGRYNGWLYDSPDDGGRAVVLYYGNASTAGGIMNIMREKDLLKYLGGRDLLIMDYPGYGINEGRPCEKSIKELTDAVKNYLENEAPYENMSFVGYSIGTGAATYAASKTDAENLILIAPYDNMINEYNTYVNIFHGPMKKIMHNTFKSDEIAPGIKCKVCVCASSADKVIPNRLTENLCSKFPDEAELSYFKTDGVSHGDLVFDENVWKHIFSECFE